MNLPKADNCQCGSHKTWYTVAKGCKDCCEITEEDEGVDRWFTIEKAFDKVHKVDDVKGKLIEKLLEIIESVEIPDEIMVKVIEAKAIVSEAKRSLK